MQREGPTQAICFVWKLCFSKTLTELFYYSLFLLCFGGLALLSIVKWMVSMITFELSHDCDPFQWSKLLSFAVPLVFSLRSSTS